MKRILPFIILTVVVFLYTKPFFHEGFFPTHDGGWAVIRLAEMQREILDGQIPPRWSDYLNHGYGYPLFTFTYPFPFYAGSVLRLFHISLVDSIKIIFVASVFLSALFMFFLGRELSGNFGGLISSLFYVIAPFRMVDLYVRGSIGESVSLAIFPLLCFLGLKYILKPSILKLILCSFVLAALILSHNIMALIFFPLWVVFLYVFVFSYYEDVRIYTFRYFLPVILLGLGLSAYFFIPALVEKQFILLSKVKLANFSDNFITLPQYITSPWSYGSKPSFQLGWAHILAAVTGFIVFIFTKGIQRKKYMPLAIFTFMGIGVLIFLAHPASADFWNLPPFIWFDFPWRLLTPLAFFLALSSVFLTLHKITRILAGFLVFLTIILSLHFAVPQEYMNYTDSYYATNDATTTSMDELMPLWVKDKPANRYTSKVEIENGTGAIYGLVNKSNSISFKTVLETAGTVKINTIYFPGWKIYVNGKEILVNFDGPDGLMRLNMEAGNDLVSGKFTRTPVRFWSDIVSLTSLAVIFILLLYEFIAGLRKKAL